MDNIDLEKKIKELLSITNYFDFAIEVNSFEKQYKDSTFFKATKKPLKEVIKEAALYYLLRGDLLKQTLQKVINELDFNKVNEILDNISTTFGQENQETLDILKEFKEVVK